MIEFRNEDCFDTMQYMIDNNIKADVILTSPPYNTSRQSATQHGLENRQIRYDIYMDCMTAIEYRDWWVTLFNKFDKVLSKDGTILWQVSYGSDITESPDSIGLLWGGVSDIIDKTDFTVADRIIWKKASAMPNNTSRNKLTRIVEDIFVFCRKEEYNTFNMNKTITSTRPNGQIMYGSVFNFISAPNNSELCNLNKATYSVELCEQLLNLYALKDALVYDPFNGTGTTGIACELLGLNYIGSEISEAQVEWSKNRLKETRQCSTNKEDKLNKVSLF